MICRHCNTEMAPRIVARPDTVHAGGELKCPLCGKHNGWAPKPRDDSKQRRGAAAKDLAKKFGRGFCELCLRSDEETRDNDCLEGHHVIPFQDGGSNDRSNIWVVCTACHRHIEWMRVYIGRVSRKAGQ